MKLKTLKDLFLGEHYHKVIQDEAIKWVKMFQSRRDKMDRREASGAEESFKNFFNITEEDLK